MTNSNQKRRVRARMAVTGENYTTALRAVREEAMALNPPHGEPRWPAAIADGDREKLGSAGWVLWDGVPEKPEHPDHHLHTAPDGRGFRHRHGDGARPHDHEPRLGAARQDVRAVPAVDRVPAPR